MSYSKAIILAFLLFTSVCVANMQGLHVEGNLIKNNQGQVVYLRGINRAGTEYACIGGWGIFDGPVDQGAINAHKSWNANVVRLPLNENCWLNINVKPEYGGDNYKNALRDFVNRLTQNDFAVIFDLHWAAPGNQKADKQLQMPNREHSITFWREVASFFRDNSNVIFDLYNEPFPGNACGDYCSDTQWNCWKNGGQACRDADQGIYWDAAGMQDLVNAVRSVGAKNIVMLGGLAWSNSISKWEQYKPYDPANQMAVSWHSYNFNYMNTPDRWNAFLAPLAAKYPVITGEMGENDCQSGYIDALMPWADNHNVHYLGWSWNPYDCKNFPALVTDWYGNPTGFGAGLKNHLHRLANATK